MSNSSRGVKCGYSSRTALIDVRSEIGIVRVTQSRLDSVPGSIRESDWARADTAAHPAMSVSIVCSDVGR